MPDKKKIDAPNAEAPKSEAPKEDVRFQAMAAEIGRLKIENLAASAGAIDAGKVFEVVNKSVKHEIGPDGIVKVVPIDENGERLRNADGTAMTVGQYVSVLKASPESGWMFADGASKPSAKATGRLETEKNPWHRDFINLGEQARLLKTDPNAARIFQAAAKGALASNPFSREGFNLTAQSRVLKDDPAAAERMRAEVAPKEPNPWKHGSEFNLTKQCFILHSDRARADRLKAEAALVNGPDKPKQYQIIPPPGSFKRMGTGR